MRKVYGRLCSWLVVGSLQLAIFPAQAQQETETPAPQPKGSAPPSPDSTAPLPETHWRPTEPQKIRLAVTEVKIGDPNIDPVVSQSLSAILAAELAVQGGDRYTVISRNDLKQLVGQTMQAQLMGCSEPACLIDLGQAAAADQLVSAAITKLGEEWVLTMDLLDVKLGTVLRRQSASWKGDPAGLVDLVRPYATRLIEGSAAEEYAGSVEILATEKNAAVRLDDKELGETPVKVVSSLPIGRHRVSIHKRGYVPFETDVVVNHKRDDSASSKPDRRGESQALVHQVVVLDRGRNHSCGGNRALGGAHPWWRQHQPRGQCRTSLGTMGMVTDACHTLR